MKIYYEIEDTADPFYLAAKQCGQAMGFAIPHLLARDSVFNIVYSESGSPMLYDKQGKSYRCHFSGNERYNLAPAFMKGINEQGSYTLKES